MTKVTDEFRAAFNYLLNEPKYLLVLRLTLLLLLFYGGFPSRVIGVLLQVICGIMIIYPPLTTSRVMWVMASSLLILYNVFYWKIFGNDQYFITYWCIACTLIVFASEPDNVMSWNARKLIGLCFLFAFFWKIIGGEYFDGTLQHFVFLVDRRMGIMSLPFGLGGDVISENKRLLEILKQTPGGGVGVSLITSPSMYYFSLLTSYWTIFIEASIAVLFLFNRPNWFEKIRDYFLITFIITTFFVFPVPTFSFTITLLGFAQCSDKRKKTLMFYLSLLVALQFSTLPMLFPSLVNTFKGYLSLGLF